jgi:hypothetical protein
MPAQGRPIGERPAVAVLERNGDLVKSLRIYIDVAPVYA